MKNSETGETEVVLGNRQLLIGFFVVVVLFATFFMMGYVVGRGTSPPAARQVEQATTSTPSGAQTDARPTASSGTVTPPASTQTPPTDQPSAYQPPPEKAPAAAPAPETRPAETTLAPVDTSSSDSTSGTYLQVVSVAQHEAEIVAHTLHDKGFPSSLSPGPNGRVRVLVGPYADLTTLGTAKASLENLGFHPIVKR